MGNRALLSEEAVLLWRPDLRLAYTMPCARPSKQQSREWLSIAGIGLEAAELLERVVLSRLTLDLANLELNLIALPASSCA